jgi:hypothetical protein
MTLSYTHPSPINTIVFSQCYPSTAPFGFPSGHFSRYFPTKILYAFLITYTYVHMYGGQDYFWGGEQSEYMLANLSLRNNFYGWPVNYGVVPQLQISLILDRLSIRYFSFFNFYLFKKFRARRGNRLAPEHPGGVNVCVRVRACRNARYSSRMWLLSCQYRNIQFYS